MKDEKPTVVTDLDPQVLALARRAFNLAREGDAAELERMLDAGLPVNLTNQDGNTLLMLAAYNGQAAAARLLLSRGADASRTNDRGQTPLAGAAFKGDVAMVRLLLDSGVPVDGAGPDGRTPFLFAAMFDRVEVMELLLARGANAQHRDAGGASAVDAARMMGAQRALARLTAAQA